MSKHKTEYYKITKGVISYIIFKAFLQSIFLTLYKHEDIFSLLILIISQSAYSAPEPIKNPEPPT